MHILLTLFTILTIFWSDRGRVYPYPHRGSQINFGGGGGTNFAGYPPFILSKQPIIVIIGCYRCLIIKEFLQSFHYLIKLCWLLWSNDTLAPSFFTHFDSILNENHSYLDHDLTLDFDLNENHSHLKHAYILLISFQLSCQMNNLFILNE